MLLWRIFRDEWLATAFDVASFQFSLSERALRFAREAEARVVKDATENCRGDRSRAPVDPFFSAIHRNLRANFISFRMGSMQLLLVRSTPSSITRSDEKIVVTYVGTVYASTEPTMMVEALHSLPAGV